MKKKLTCLSLAMIFSPSLWAGGSLSGIVTYQGQLPPLKKSAVTIDSHVCGKESKSEGLVVGKRGGVKNTVIYILGPVVGAKVFPEGPGGFVVNQMNCRFEPHVVIVGRESPLTVRNSDNILHNFHTYSRSNPALNKAQPRSMLEMTLKFERPEIFEVRCDVHDWMQGWVVVADHPYYAVTDDEGKFRLTDIPAGDYTLSLWHESLGSQSKRIQVVEGEEAKVDYKLTKE